MTVDEARAIWEPERRGDGWLDTQARVESARPLTDAEEEAAAVLWAEFLSAMEAMAQAFSAVSAVRSAASASIEPGGKP